MIYCKDLGLEISQIYSAAEQNTMEDSISAIPGANETFYWIGMKRNTRLVFVLVGLRRYSEIYQKFRILVKLLNHRVQGQK